jgi:hypothetical protein
MKLLTEYKNATQEVLFGYAVVSCFGRCLGVSDRVWKEGAANVNCELFSWIV